MQTVKLRAFILTIKSHVHLILKILRIYPERSLFYVMGGLQQNEDAALLHLAAHKWKPVLSICLSCFI